jgi:hypothetical protein
MVDALPRQILPHNQKKKGGGTNQSETVMPARAKTKTKTKTKAKRKAKVKTKVRTKAKTTRKTKKKVVEKVKTATAAKKTKAKAKTGAKANKKAVATKSARRPLRGIRVMTIPNINNPVTVQQMRRKHGWDSQLNQLL